MGSTPSDDEPFKKDTMVPFLSLEEAGADRLTNLFRSVAPSGPSYEIDPLCDLAKITQNEDSIILFELIPVDKLNSINRFFSEHYDKQLLSIESRIQPRVYQNAVSSFEVNLQLSTHVTQTVLHSCYNFGNYVQVSFICKIKIDGLDHSDDTTEQIISKRLEKINSIQKEIESNIPEILHGFFYTNEIQSFTKPHILPSLILFNTSQYSHFLEKRPSSTLISALDRNTERQRADSFLRQFEKNPYGHEPDSHLGRIGIFPTFLTGLIDKSLIISVDDLNFVHPMGTLPCRYVGFHFQNISNILEDELLLDFVQDLSLNISVDSILTKIRIDVESSSLVKLTDIGNESELKSKRQAVLSSKDALITTSELFSIYADAIKDALDINALGSFLNEETWISSFGKGRNARSISDYFNELRTKKTDDITTRLSHKKERIEDQLEFVNNELILIKNKPVINTFLKDVEDDLVHQILKWKEKIHKKNIQEWLLNFESTEERKIALKILDKISYIAYDDLKSLSVTLHNRIQQTLGNSYKSCFFSFVGKVTSGSAHIQKLFQEQNQINESKFAPLDKLPSVSEPTPLILLDDFIGSGQTFSKWFKNTEIIQKLQKNNYQIHYCVLTAFEKGKSYIEEETKIPVVFGYKYGKKQQVRDGDIFDTDDKDKIKTLVEKYSPNEPEFSWGYDDCQLLVALESNIPNNSLSILWSEKNWTPLLKRL